MTRIQQFRGTGWRVWGMRALLCAGVLPGCGGDPDGDSRTAGGAANAAGSGSGKTGQGASGSGDFGNAPGMSTGGSARPTTPVKPGDRPADCVGETQNAKQVDVDMYIMLDRSDSMEAPTGSGASKWDAIRSALTAFVGDPASTGLGVGLQYFPLAAPGKPEECFEDAACGAGDLCGRIAACVPTNPNATTLTPCAGNQDCPRLSPGCAILGQCEQDPSFVCFGIGADGCSGDPGGACIEIPGVCELYASCDAAAYARPAVAIGVLPGNGMALVDSLAARGTTGATPTPPALEGALMQASAYAAANPTHRVINVLATDGLPTTCLPEAITTVDGAIEVVSDIAMRGLTLRPAVETYVIGVFAPEETDAMPNLLKIAKAGGTDTPFIVDASQDVNQQFLEALSEIRGGALDCEFNLPEAPDGKEVDYKLVNVELTDSSGKRSLEYVTSADHCADSALGWYYDADPLMGGTPSKISVCETTCETLRKAQDASVEIRLGCASITPL